jgi:hypothetical protein|nr:MAG TPA: hypothetical protein [Caudoviricetes sp.]
MAEPKEHIYLVIGGKSVIKINPDSLPTIKGFVVEYNSKIVTILYNDGQTEQKEGTSFLEEEKCGKLHTLDEVMFASFNSRFIYFCGYPVAVFNTDRYRNICMDEFGNVFLSDMKDKNVEVASLGIETREQITEAPLNLEILQNYCFDNWKRFFTYVLGSLKNCYDYVVVNNKYDFVLLKEYPEYGEDGDVIQELGCMIYKTPGITMNWIEPYNIYSINNKYNPNEIIKIH